jgi:hypothetical protein
LSEPEFLELRNDQNFKTISKFHKFFNSKNSGSDNIIQENAIKSQKSPQIPVQKNSNYSSQSTAHPPPTVKIC